MLPGPAPIGLGMNHSPMGMTVQPPYIRFETKAMERRKLVEEGGAVYYENVIFASVTSHGSKDTVVKIADEWFAKLREDVRQGRFPPQWLEFYEASLRAYKANEEPPVAGHSIKNWPMATPAEIKNCTQIGVRAIEDLANANEEVIHRLGMGGRNLATRAKEWLAANSGDSKALVQQAESDRNMIAGLKAQLQQAQDKNKVLEMQLVTRPQGVGMPAGAYLPPLESRLEDARAAADDDATVVSDVLKSIGEE